MPSKCRPVVYLRFCLLTVKLSRPVVAAALPKVATRSGRIFIVKNGELSSRFMRIDAPPIGIVCISSRDICIGQAGKVIHSFHIKGKKNWSMNVGHDIRDMTLFSRGKGDKSRALLVALANGEIRLYNERHLVCSISSPDAVLGMRCGRYGREDVSLVLVHKSGALSVKIFRRAASTDVVTDAPPPEQDIPIKVRCANRQVDAIIIISSSNPRHC